MQNDNLLLLDSGKQELKFQTLKKQADLIVDNIKKMDIQFIKSMVHPPQAWIPVYKIIYLLFTNQSIMKNKKFYSFQNEAKPKIFNKSQFVSVFRSITLGNNNMREFMKSIDTVFISNSVFQEIQQVLNNEISQQIQNNLKNNCMQFLNLWLWSKLMVKKLIIQRKGSKQ